MTINVSRGARIALWVTGGVVVVGGTTLAVLWQRSFCHTPKKKTGFILEQAWIESPDVLSPERIAQLKEGDRAMAAFAYVKDQGDAPKWQLKKTSLDKGESLVLIPVVMGEYGSSIRTRCRIDGPDGPKTRWIFQVPDPKRPSEDWHGWLFPADYDKKLKRSEFWGLNSRRLEPAS